MARTDSRSGRVGRADVDEEPALGGGAEPVREYRQETAGSGRSVGLGLSTLVGALLIAIPLVWGGAYLMQAGAAGLTGGFGIMVLIVLLACLGAGAILLKGMFKA